MREFRRFYKVSMALTLAFMALIALISVCYIKLRDAMDVGDRRNQTLGHLAAYLENERPALMEDLLRKHEPEARRRVALDGIAGDTAVVAIALVPSPTAPVAAPAGNSALPSPNPVSHPKNPSALQWDFDDEGAHALLALSRSGSPAGALHVRIWWKEKAPLFVVPDVLALSLVCLLLFVGWTVVMARVNRILFVSLLAAYKSRSVEAAIAKTTQILAHDVRKPFSMLKIAIDMLGSTREPERVQQVVAKVVPEVEKAMQSVNGLINDVMAAGDTSRPSRERLERACPEDLIESTLVDCFRLYPDADISITYDLAHARTIDVDMAKVGRVFSNIIANAVQAMDKRGAMWFRTRDVAHGGKAFVEFCVGNSGSFVGEEDLPKLFEAFYTKGKKGRAGLGLAIAQKIVEAHDGRIWCTSSRDVGVELWFTLPAETGGKGVPLAESACAHRSHGEAGALPANSQDVQALLARSSEAEVPALASTDRSQTLLEREIVALSTRLGRKIKVLVVDDEAVYRNALVSSLSISEPLTNAVCLCTASDDKSALAAAEKENPELIILDVDLGPGTSNGFDICEELRKRQGASFICIHSNRMLATDHRTALESGADAFLPKPIGRMQLLKLIIQSVPTALLEVPADPGNPEEVPAPAAPAPGAPESTLPELAIVDDNIFTLEAWEMMVKDARVKTFDSPEAFERQVEADPGYLSRLTCIVTDYFFDNSVRNGLEFARNLKEGGVRAPIFLCSDADFALDTLRGVADGKIPKAPLSWAELMARV